MIDPKQPPPGPRPEASGPDQTGPLIHVAAAAIVNDNGEVLLSKRHPDAHQGGLWEFPGGKLEPDETVEQGLKRELHEELGIAVKHHRPLIRVRHRYPDRTVLLDVHRVECWEGEPHGREAQPLAWAAPDVLQDYPMPPADVPIVRALLLTACYLITPTDVGDPTAFLDNLRGSLEDGIGLVQLRLFDLSESALLRLGQKVSDLCHEHGARVLLNGEPAVANAIGADGVHLNSRALLQYRQRPVEEGRLLAASCHSHEQLSRAIEIGADFALLSPVLPTRSHPDAEPLGWERFAALVDDVALPVFALGGMHPDLVETAWSHGAQGVAGIRGLWGHDPAR